MRPVKLASAVTSAVIAAAISSSALADKASDTLNIAFEASVATLDFYFLNIDEGYSIAQSVCDTLVFRDPETMEIKPLLATSWEWTGPKQIDMTLREGVKFHNGETFDADDVVFTLNWASDPKTGAYGQVMVDWIDHVEKLEPYKVRIYQKAESRAVLDQLSSGLPIYPADYYKEVGTEGFSAQPICTGPYKVTSVETGAEVVLERNEDYFEGSPKGKAQISRIVMRSVQDTNTRMAELMTGQVDFIYKLTADQADQLKNVPDLTLSQIRGTRIAYMMFNPVNPPADSPIKDVRVRKAIAHTIDRDGIVANLIRGVSTRLDTFCNPVMPGCIDGVFTYEHDLDKAKALLAEAGYPNGFNIDIYAYRDRFVTEALIGDLQKVGINANLNYMQYASLDENWRKGNLSIAHQTWAGFGLMDAGNHLVSHYLGPDSITQDEAIKDKVRAGFVAPTPEERDADYGEALKMLAEGVYWVPLYIVTENYAFTKDLEYQPSNDGINRFYFAKWK